MGRVSSFADYLSALVIDKKEKEKRMRKYIKSGCPVLFHDSSKKGTLVYPIINGRKIKSTSDVFKVADSIEESGSIPEEVLHGSKGH